MTLDEIRRIAGEVAAEHDSNLEVVGARLGEDTGHYVELFLTLHGCAQAPCQMMLGVDRRFSEEELRARVAEGLRHHLDGHRVSA